jgi:diguanylate cyclase (GGDEF)-like protein
MIIRTKVFVIVIVLFAILGGINFLIQRYIIYPSFLHMEYNEAGENLKRIFQAIDREIVHLDTMCGDWALWDDTYSFMNKHSKPYIASNLNKETLASNRLNLLVYCRSDGTIAWMYATDFAKRTPSFDFMAKGKIALQHPLLDVRDMNGERKGKTGVFSSQFGPLLFSTRNILHSNGSGPSNGFLIMGRFLDASLQKTLKEQTRIDFDIIYPLPDTGSLCGAERAETISRGDLNYYILPHEAYLKTCSAYQDAYKESCFGVQYLFPREITRKGIASMKYAVAMMIISAAVILVLLSMLLQWIILRPVQRLTEHADRLEKEGDYSLRLDLNRRDEIGRLASSFDTMVHTIKKRSEDLKSANEQLTRMSMLDGLTGIANRRMFDLHLKREWRQAMRDKEPLSLILLDVDFFKLYNDTYGHQKGDQCLIAVAAALQQQARRPSDLIARYGGEEFAVVLPNTHAEGAMMLAEKARLAVQELRMEHSASTVCPFVSISLGVATRIPQIEHGASGMDSFLEKADEALYLAKHQGRNRVVRAS